MSSLDTWRRKSGFSSPVGPMVHPTKVLVIEAVLWIDQPVPAAELVKVLDGTVGLAAVSYHLKSLVPPEARAAA